MPFVKNVSYPTLPFTDDAFKTDFYIYYNLHDLTSKSDIFTEGTAKCRTIGVLQSINGKYYLTDLDSPSDDTQCLVQVSMIYLKSPAKSTVIPYPVQVFGTLQWRNRPVIFAKLLQMMNPSMAIRMRDTMRRVTSIHLAKQNEEEQEPP